jgi:anti-sigma28 factor (negative regulator of flagellin synthesis)
VVAGRGELGRAADGLGERAAGRVRDAEGLAVERQLRARLADLPDPAGQAARVKELTALVASGRYQVDGTRIAQALLRDEPTAALLGLPGGDV